MKLVHHCSVIYQIPLFNNGLLVSLEEPHPLFLMKTI